MDTQTQLSGAAIKALLYQEKRGASEVARLVKRLAVLRGCEPVWSIRMEVKSIDKQLSRVLARLNKINGIFVKYGNREEC